MTTLTTIETPERVAFTYDVAGLGTRAIAYLIDLAIRIAALLLLMVAAVALFGQSINAEKIPSWVLTVGVILFFLGQWCYFAFFEGFCGGQTPGKRLMAIRVIKDGGYPASFFDAALRNLVRVVDFLPAAYGVGVVAIFFSSRHQRLGDIVAGTLVVRRARGRALSLDGILAAHGAADGSPQARASRLALSVSEFEALVEFLQRAPSLDPAPRQRIAAKFAADLRRRIAASPVLREKYPAEQLDDETLLARVVREESGEEDGVSQTPGAEGPPR